MLILSLQGQDATQSLLRTGYSYCIVVNSQTQRFDLLQGLAGQPGAAVVSEKGGLISNLRIWENILLPVQYHDVQISGGADAKIAQLFAQCGLGDPEQQTELLRKLPDQLTSYERRLVGFVRAMLVEPELLVLDCIYEGLAKEDADKVGHFDRIFHLYFPFRTSVLISFEEHRDASNPRQRIIHF